MFPGGIIVSSSLQLPLCSFPKEEKRELESPSALSGDKVARKMARIVHAYSFLRFKCDFYTWLRKFGPHEYSISFSSPFCLIRPVFINHRFEGRSKFLFLSHFSAGLSYRNYRTHDLQPNGIFDCQYQNENSCSRTNSSSSSLHLTLLLHSILHFVYISIVPVSLVFLFPALTLSVPRLFSPSLSLRLSLYRGLHLSRIMNVATPIGLSVQHYRHPSSSFLFPIHQTSRASTPPSLRCNS